MSGSTFRRETQPEARATRVKQLVAQGLTAKLIGQRLSISTTLAQELVRAAKQSQTTTTGEPA
jgi:DNA-binding NarL/FixJ family response regulator